jgi:phosphoribosylformylglycinamidine cyclo-ligase
VLPEGLGVALDLAAIPVPPVFSWLAKTGGVAEREMLRTFNCGIGMIVAAEAGKAEEVAAALRAAGEAPVRLGEVIAINEGEEAVSYRGKLAL